MREMKAKLSQRVIAGHSRPKDGVASLAYDPAIHERVQRQQSYVSPLMSRCLMDARVKCLARGHDRHLFGDITDTFVIGQVDSRDLMGGEENAVSTIGV